MAMKFKNFTPEARRYVVALGLDKPGALDDDMKRRFERSWHLAKEDGSDVITEDHIRRALAEA